MYIFLATGATGRENEMTTGGNYLILLPSPPPCPSSNRIGVRRRYGGGGRGRGAGAFNIVGRESGNFFPSLLLPLLAGSSVSA